MTREIKFRGQAIASKYVPPRWWYGGIMVDGYDVWMCVKTEEKGVVSVKVDPSTIGQYTGLRDKNGVEIYEGDIVTIKGAVSATVEWNNFGFHLYGLEDVSGRRPDYAFSDFNQIEVIGNIHERKEEPK